MADDFKNLDDILNEYDEDKENEESDEESTDEDDESEIEEDEDLAQDQEDSAKDQALLASHIDNVMPINLSSCMKDSFLSYAMSVIVARALPDVRDGFKPVQRRILFTMNELGIFNDKPYKKSARIVGDVMGKYHPHGDSSIYEAMVRMAQDFAYRYPLVEGHGNFGSIDGDGAAAMRYTEAKLSKISMEMLRDLNKDTVDFVDNYDGTEKEPSILPARFPNILVNGATGIAVGMATSIPTHNLREVINGTLALIKNPNITTDQLMDYIPGPDFPTGGKIMGLAGVKQAYDTGIGSVVCRAKTEITTLKNGKKEILVREIPYQVNKKKLIERIAELAKEKVIEGITDLRDETSRKGMKIVIELRRDVNENVILNKLYRFTQMQSAFSVNMIAIDHGQPKCLTLKDILNCYIKHQIEVVTRRTKFDLQRAKARIHIVDGLLIALSNIDAVVQTIKKSSSTDDACVQLMNNFALTEIQARAILDMKLQRLTSLEVNKLRQEKADLQAVITYLEELLNSHDKLMEKIEQELIEMRDKYGDERRTEIDLTEDLDVADEELIEEKDVIVTITNKGYVKRLPADTYKVQKRGGKGVTGSKVQDDDFIKNIMYCSTHENLLFFTNFGQVYNIKAYQIPEASRFSKGLPVVNLLKFQSGEHLAAVINIRSLEEEGYLIFATKKGNVKKTEISKFKNIRSTGIRAIILNEGDEVIKVERSNGKGSVIIGGSNGRAVRFDEELVRSTNRNAAGVKAIRFDDPTDKVVGMAIIESEKDEITVITENGYGKRTHASAFKEKGRNGKGVKYLNITEKCGKPVTFVKSNKDSDLMVVTDRGMVIRMELSNISVIGRDTQGVCLIKLNEGQKVASIEVIDKNTPDAEE